MILTAKADLSTKPALSENPVLRAYCGEVMEQVPIWFMRQAGRYLPEYRAVREKHSMLDVIRTPELACEVTLQPLRRFELDAAIIFADILNPLIGMGMQLDFIENEGPKIANPIRSAADVERLIVPSAEENVPYTLKAISMTSRELNPRGIAVLGFSGAPFTLSAYMIEGGGSAQLSTLKKFMYAEPEAWHKLQEKISQLLIDYLCAQVHAGASAVQVFDSWVGHLGAADFSEYVLPYLKTVFTKVKQITKVPMVYFSTGTAGLMSLIAEIPGDVVSVDWRLTLPQARQALGPRVALQGNLDPLLLHASDSKLEQETKRVLNESDSIGAYVFNLGHGIVPKTDPANIERVIRIVKEYRRCLSFT